MAKGKASIPYGFIVMSRYLADHSELKYLNPRARDLFWYLFRNANHEDNNLCKRGQLLRRYDDIIQALSWRVGYRQVKYTKDQMKALMKQLRTAGRITTRKTVRGVIITICNYDRYNIIKNYERPDEASKENPDEMPNERLQCRPTINKNVNKNVKNLEGPDSKKNESEAPLMKKKSKAYVCSNSCKGHGYQVKIFGKKFESVFGLPYDDKQSDYVNAARAHKKYGCSKMIEFQRIFWQKYDSDDNDFLGHKRPSFSVFTSLIVELIPIYSKRFKK